MNVPAPHLLAVEGDQCAGGKGLENGGRRLLKGDARRNLGKLEGADALEAPDLLFAADFGLDLVVGAFVLALDAVQLAWPDLADNRQAIAGGKRLGLGLR